MFLLMTVITGLIYPLMITAYAQLMHPYKSNGSMISFNNKIIGSELIGQQFIKPEYFWGRPSSIGNNPMPSGGSNLNPLGSTFKEYFSTRVDTIRKYHGNIELSSIPRDLLFSSGSGVDPHISLEAAYFQIERISKYRHLSELQIKKLKEIVQSSIESPDLLIFGEYRINVLKLNLQLNSI